MYNIYYRDEPCGTAEVFREGLYYLLECRCETPDRNAYKILMKNGENILDLGVCVPYKTYFGVRKRIPTKQIVGTDLFFRLVPFHEKRNGKWILLQNDVPFPHLDQLEKAVLCPKEDAVYVFIPD